MDKKKVKARFLLGTYLLVVLFSSSPVDCYSEGNSNIKLHHTHDSYDEMHHEHNFHIGIFHYLTHIYESLVEVDVKTDKHVAITPTLSNENKITDSVSCVQDYFPVTILIECGVNVLANPPPYNWITHKNFHCPPLPLRAPPSVA